MRTRVGLGILGVVAGVYGAFLMFSRQDLDALLEVGIWMAVGVVVHDFVLAPLLIGVGVLVPRLPAAVRESAAVGLVVLGSVTLLAVPVLGRFGVEADNPTLFDRPYAAGWAVLAGLVLAGVAAAALVQDRRHRPGPGGRGAGPRPGSG